MELTPMGMERCSRYIPVACTVRYPFMLLDHRQHELILDKTTGPTYVPKVFVGAIGIQPVLLHIIKCRTRSLFCEKLGTRVKCDCR